MNLKQRIENMKLPGHNGPALRGRPVQNRVLLLKLARRIEQKHLDSKKAKQ